MESKVTILGGGAFGTSIATLLANNGYDVSLWCYEKEVVDQINNEHENKKFFPSFRLDEKIKATLDLKEALSGSKFVFQAIPVKFLRDILTKAKDYFTENQIIISLSKGIEQESFLLPTQIINDVLHRKEKVFSMAGPNFAKEIAQKYYTSTILAGDENDLLNDIRNILQNDYFKVYFSDDLIGVQVGSALKNVITLAAGIIKGAFPEHSNLLASAITIGLLETAQLTKVLGGKEKSIYDLSGLGDLILTSTGNLSRNLKFGILFGQGKTIDQVQKEIPVLPEGLNTVKSVYDFAKNNNLDLPICTNIYEVIFENKDIHDFIKNCF